MSAITKRSSAFMVIEVSMANPNGNPDYDNQPRTVGDRGFMTPVSLKRKIRDSLEDHKSPCFRELMEISKLDPEKYHIFESIQRGFPELNQIEATEMAFELMKNSRDKFLDKYFDARLFGYMCLEDATAKKQELAKIKKAKEKDDSVEVPANAGNLQVTNTGCLTLSPAVSIAKVNIVEETLSKKAPQRSVAQDLAPGAYKVVEHGIYVAKLEINPHIAHRTNATTDDVEVLKSVLPYMFQINASNARPAASISVRHIWWRNHTNAIGSFNQFQWYESLMPKFINESSHGCSTGINDYFIPTCPVSVDLVK
jgi:Cas7 group CRISPR-associated protein Csh2